MGSSRTRPSGALAGRCHASKAAGVRRMDVENTVSCIMKKSKLSALALLLLLLTQTAGTQTLNFKEFRLSNGLRVILSEDHSAPTYTIAVTYNVGSRDEKAGQTGYAHLFEHMMFQGSQKIGKG